MTPAVEAMLTNPQAPTAPLHEFLDAYRADENLWWKLPSGHHQNLFDEAIDTLDLVDDLTELRRAVRRALNELGVPDAHYPAPVTNAVEILTDALGQTRPEHS